MEHAVLDIAEDDIKAQVRLSMSVDFLNGNPRRVEYGTVPDHVLVFDIREGEDVDKAVGEIIDTVNKTLRERTEFYLDGEDV